MAIHVALRHQTTYRYDRLVSLSPHIIRLRPAPHCRTPILGYSLKVAPRKHFINWQQDPHGNYLARLVFPEQTRELIIDVEVIAEMAVLNPFDFFLEPSAEEFPFSYEPWLGKELAPFLERVAAGPLLRELLAGIDVQPQRTVDFLVQLNRRIATDVKYIIRLEPGVQTPEETLSIRSGSCRDSGWLLVQALRHLGLAARFVSGYLIQLTSDVKSLDGPPGPATDFTDLHAWAEVYVPGAGWIGLDPTSGLLAGEGHVPLAATPDPQSAAPVTGVVDESEISFTHEMHVRRIFESPRVTKPYTDRQWREIDGLGYQIDEELRTHDVRLTMGGEPTFVSIDDMDGAEWNFTALGPAKRHLAGVLIRRLKQRFAPGGLLHYGQGKWYPGESLPRWALACWWRRDGMPIWVDDGLIADETIAYGHGDAEAKRFIDALTEVLGVDNRYVIPAFEDVWHYLWAERRLPVNVDPFQSNLRNEEDRARLSRIFEQGLDRVAGYVLPLERVELTPDTAVRLKPDTADDASGDRWVSGRWFFRSGRMFLIAGDSPIGYRLPLDSLPWAAPEDQTTIEPRDPFAPLEPLPPRQQFVRTETREPRAAGPFGTMVRRGESAAGVIRTALCVEPRDGRVHVFMPPVRTTDDYLDLIAAVEQTAALLRMPVIIEGTSPDHDPRLNHIKVTPDPGVIEVNMHPAHCWEELVFQTTTLYEEARQSRLGTEKFMLDGRHTGTGGGNHVVIGGPTAADSPILRRPDMLRSLVGYWHNHPSLSFLFSGAFIGPTSQHPRVDEGRKDAIHELEVAFDQIPDREDAPPWLADRVFRHLLVDVTGNTHRAEFCIDKLYAPEASGGRQGLVEFRAFEMPPHPMMSLSQQLLLRALIARFWKIPYNQPLVRWDTVLHDRFMLPHFVAEDFHDVVADLQRDGYPLQPDWFAPHIEFRFPVCGSMTHRGIHVELRQALEPWYVLGEEPGAGGMVRHVDSSVERLQVKVTGMTSSRHFLTCNERAVPLHPTGTDGEFVAGIRYRAWQPSACLHPTIPVHTPLVFDLIDAWNQRSLGGCTYHVAHPGGRHFETFPVNAYEAESRRLARFAAIGHTPGPIVCAPEKPRPDGRLTLDLRCPAVPSGAHPHVIGLGAPQACPAPHPSAQKTRAGDPAGAERGEGVASTPACTETHAGDPGPASDGETGAPTARSSRGGVEWGSGGTKSPGLRN
jgi:uncharacterized protein (DUF2126 family)/transglutaminase-like putative cysteine protease